MGALLALPLTNGAWFTPLFRGGNKDVLAVGFIFKIINLKIVKMKKEKTMRQLFEDKKKFVLKTHEIGRTLDRLIEEKWGFHYSETDSDSIIDTLDYDTSSISFSDFRERMDEYKSTRREDGSFVSRP